LILQAVLALGLTPTSADAQVNPRVCGAIYERGAFGPYDYRTDKFFLPVVENAHFTPEVEALIRGKTGARVEPDLDYTLRKFPNHHRALAAVLRRSITLGMIHIPFLPLPVECYFERALRFKPDDAVARMIYVRFLIVQKRLDDARLQLQDVESRAADSPLTLQNAGLLYLAMQDHEKALELAHRLIAKGGAGEPLKGQLQAAGRWRDPVVGAATEPAASAPAAAASTVPPGARP